MQLNQKQGLRNPMVRKCRERLDSPKGFRNHVASPEIKSMWVSYKLSYKTLACSKGKPPATREYFLVYFSQRP